MNSFEPEWEHAVVAAARFTLDDGREFIFSCIEHEPRQFSFQALPHGPRMTADDMELLVQVHYFDELGRCAGRMTRAQTDMTDSTPA
jgi:hypothetical protein